MKLPNVVHPTKFETNGVFLEVVSYSSLTDDQARKIAIMFCRSHKILKKDKGKTIQILTQFDKNSAGIL